MKHLLTLMLAVVATAFTTTAVAADYPEINTETWVQIAPNDFAIRSKTDPNAYVVLDNKDGIVMLLSGNENCTFRGEYEEFLVGHYFPVNDRNLAFYFSCYGDNVGMHKLWTSEEMTYMYTEFINSNTVVIGKKNLEFSAMGFTKAFEQYKKNKTVRNTI